MIKSNSLLLGVTQLISVKLILLEHTTFLLSSFHISTMARFRRNISIGIPLDLSIPTEMTSIEPLVENKKSLKTPKKLIIMLCYSFFD